MDIAFGKLRISGAALLALAAAYFFDTNGLLAAVLAAAAVHEAGHYIALKIRRQRIEELKLELWGLSMRCDAQMPYVAEIITAAAGPLASLFLAVVSSFYGRWFGSQNAYILSGVSFVFFAFNLLPVMPLDGGRIVYAGVVLIADLEKGESLSRLLSCAVIMALLAAGTAVLVETKVNFTLLLAAVWLLISYCKRSHHSIKSSRKIVGSEKWKTN